MYITLSKKSRAWDMAAVRFKISKRQSWSVTNPHWREEGGFKLNSHTIGRGDYSYIQCTSVGARWKRKNTCRCCRQIGVQQWGVTILNKREERVKRLSKYREQKLVCVFMLYSCLIDLINAIEKSSITNEPNSVWLYDIERRTHGGGGLQKPK